MNMFVVVLLAFLAFHSSESIYVPGRGGASNSGSSNSQQTGSGGRGSSFNGNNMANKFMDAVNKRGGLRDDILEYFVNDYRQRHGVPSIRVDARLKLKALKCADQYAISKVVVNNSVTAMDALASINNYYCDELNVLDAVDYPYTGGNTAADMVEMLNRWYKERHGTRCPITNERIAPYNYQTPNMTSIGYFDHFTQLVWKGTTKMACAVSSTPNLAEVTPDVPIATTTASPQEPRMRNPGHYVTVCLFSPPLLAPKPSYYKENVPCPTDPNYM